MNGKERVSLAKAVLILSALGGAGTDLAAILRADNSEFSVGLSPQLGAV